MTLYIISYDIPSNDAGTRRRAKLARYLEGIAIRVQMSVFELRMQPEKLNNICLDIEEIIDAKEDTVKIYPVCENCQKKSLSYGTTKTYDYDDVIFF